MAKNTLITHRWSFRRYVENASTSKRTAQRENEERFYLMFEHHDVVMLLIDPLSGRILEANSAAQDFYGYSRAVLKQMNIAQINVLPSVEVVKEYTRAVEKERNIFIFPHRIANGDLRLVEVHASSINLGGKRLLFSIILDVTEREQISQSLFQSEEQLRLALQATNLGVWQHDLLANTVYLDNRARELYGLDQSSVTADKLFERIHPDDLYRVKTLIAASMDADGGHSYTVEYRIVGPDKKDRWLVVNAQVDFMGEAPDRYAIRRIGTVQDNTDRHHAREAIIKRTEELSLLLEAGRELSAALDLETIYAILNRYISQMMPCDALIVSSYNPQTHLIRCEYLRENQTVMDVSSFPLIPLEPEGQGTQSLVIRSGQSLLLPQYEKQRATSTTKFYYDENGDLYEAIPEDLEDEDRPRSAIMVPLLTEGQVTGVLQIFSSQYEAHNVDHLRFVETLAFRVSAALSNAVLFQKLQTELGERRSAEEEVRKLNTELEQRVLERTSDLSRANAELERAARAKDEFLASMSHELRTPLNAILTFAESLEEGTYGSLNDPQHRPIRAITESGQHLLNLINDILDLSKIEAGKLVLQIDRVEVEPLCEASLRMVRQQALKKNQQISLNFDPQVEVVQADPRYLKQMLVNLLSNAVKFTPNNGTIGLEVLGDPEHNRVIFRVIDNGIGIAADQMDKLFKPFVQVDAGLSRQYEGTGLGLALVYRMARLHGGGVGLESEPGRGSQFTITLPWLKEQGAVQEGRQPLVNEEASEQNLALLSPPCPVISSRPSDHAPLILLAEDSPTNQTTFMDFLMSKGYRVMLASNGIEAIERVREVHPDLILMDIQMPGMDGLEAMRRLRADPELKSTGIIALTAMAMPGDRERCLAAGANDYLSKPVSLKLLFESIESHLR